MLYLEGVIGSVQRYSIHALRCIRNYAYSTPVSDAERQSTQSGVVGVVQASEHMHICESLLEHCAESDHTSERPLFADIRAWVNHSGHPIHKLSGGPVRSQTGEAAARESNPGGGPRYEGRSVTPSSRDVRHPVCGQRGSGAGSDSEDTFTSPWISPSSPPPTTSMPKAGPNSGARGLRKEGLALG